MSEGQEQDKTEEATAFKLRKAREKGKVARGTDVGFVGSLLALGAAGLMFGEGFVVGLAALMRHALGAGVAKGGDVASATSLAGALAWAAFAPLAALGAMLMIVLLTLELLQLRGFLFSTHPLKPDFKRLDPAQGFKRVFSVRMLQETFKTVVKFVAYATAAGWLLLATLDDPDMRPAHAAHTAAAFVEAGGRLVATFIGLAILFMVLDQIIVRREFRKQMRMSRSELTRETKDREGEPRIKQKRRDLHARLREQTEGLGRLAGSDLVVVNPEHYAVALRYNAAEADAPVVRTKGRNHFAQLVKRKARLLSIPVISDAALARELYRSTLVGQPIAPVFYLRVATIYRRLG